MRLIHSVKGISKLILLLLLLIAFVVGALLSYIWTMGFYAPQVFHLPSQANITLEKAEFYAENATFFNVTILNPSYSPEEVAVEQILVSTNDGLLHKVPMTFPSLPYTLTPGNFQTFQSYWKWADYVGQTVDVIALVQEGTGSTVEANTPLMNLTVASINFDASVSATNFTVTVQSTGSQTFMNITEMRLVGKDVEVSPSLPYTLEAGASATFTFTYNWSDIQGENATVSIETLQGFTAKKTQLAPEVLKILSPVFDVANTTSFNITVQNVATLQVSLNISQIKVDVQGETVIIENVVPQLPYLLEPNSEVPLTCSWNWSEYQGKGVKATVTVYTQQGFSRSAEASIP